MTYLTKILWIVPLAAHLGYVAATANDLPPVIGEANSLSGGVDRAIFLIQWLCISGATNLCFLMLAMAVPRLPRRLLQVPGHTYWLSNERLRAELVARIRFAIETSLLGINVFLAAVYQLIYESVVSRPVLSFPLAPLVAFFMALPVIAAILVTGITMFGLGREARKSGRTACNSKENTQ